MENSFGNNNTPEEETKKQIPVWVKVTGTLVLSGVIAILLCEYGFMILLMIWAVIWVFGLLIGKG